MLMELIKNIKYEVTELEYNYGHYIVPENIKDGVAVDIGANNGFFIEKYKNFFNKICAYEANFFLCEKLKEKFQNNDNIEIYNNAVSNNSGEILKLVKYKWSNTNGCFAILKNETIKEWDANEVVCETISINIEDILKKFSNKIDFIKIDCETSEYDFLINKDLKSIKYIALELHCQLGKEKYTELYNFILKTHKADQELNYRDGEHQEILFSNLALEEK